jgi:hypothetical protein
MSNEDSKWIILIEDESHDPTIDGMPLDLANGRFFLIEEDDERRTIVRDLIARGARVLTAESLMRELAEGGAKPD